MPAMFSLNYHAMILAGACPSEIPHSVLWGQIIPANLAIDSNQLNSQLHFDNCTFELGLEVISNRWLEVEAGNDVYANFGALTHTVQDFYAHSNWVELHLSVSPIPVWNLDVASLPDGIVSGVFWLDSPKLCGPGAPTHEELNKDNPTSQEGQKVVPDGPNQGKTLFELAFDAARRATEEQFARLLKVAPIG